MKNICDNIMNKTYILLIYKSSYQCVMCNFWCLRYLKKSVWLWFLEWADHLEKGMAIHFSILAWRILWTEEPGGLHTVHGVTKSWIPLNSYFLFLFLPLIYKSSYQCVRVKIIISLEKLAKTLNRPQT